MVAADGALWKLSGVDGALSRWVDVGDEPGELCLGDLAIGGDGTTYVFDGCAFVVRRVGTDGTVGIAATEMWDVTGMTLLPDGTLYLAEWLSGIWRVEPDGGKANVVTDQNPTAVAFNPIDGKVYYALYNSSVRRYDPTDGGTEEVAPSIRTVAYDMEVGASGNWYVRHFEGVATYDAEFQELDYALARDEGTSLTLVNGGVVATTMGCRGAVCGAYGEVFRLPVDDRPAGVGPGRVGAWIPTVEAFPGDTVSLPVRFDLSVVGEGIGGVTASVAFDTSAVRFLAAGPGDFQGSIEVVGDSASSGVVHVSASNPDPDRNRDTTSVAVIHLEAIGGGGVQSPVTLSVHRLTGTGGTDLTNDVQVVAGAVSILVAVGLWGDANGDERITALDALICLSGVVGKDVSRFESAACDVAPDSGTEFTGKVTAIDALAILSHVVGRQLPTRFRVNRPR